ncbi:MAG: LytTR family transcriptional regulator, partial [Lachnospiraceae bacterium]|nr:LytTR family transcriptional regulator [Lachnospiraceae bacterium]
MQVEVKIDASCHEPKLIILTDAMTEEVNSLIQKLSDHNLQMISGSKDGKITILEPDVLFRIYA